MVFWRCAIGHGRSQRENGSQLDSSRLLCGNRDGIGRIFNQQARLSVDRTAFVAQRPSARNPSPLYAAVLRNAITQHVAVDRLTKRRAVLASTSSISAMGSAF